MRAFLTAVLLLVGGLAIPAAAPAAGLPPTTACTPARPSPATAAPSAVTSADSQAGGPRLETSWAVRGPGHTTRRTISSGSAGPPGTMWCPSLLLRVTCKIRVGVRSVFVCIATETIPTMRAMRRGCQGGGWWRRLVFLACLAAWASLEAVQR